MTTLGGFSGRDSGGGLALERGDSRVGLQRPLDHQLGHREPVDPQRRALVGEPLLDPAPPVVALGVEQQVLDAALDERL